jgi:hypothetical protein
MAKPAVKNWMDIPPDEDVLAMSKGATSGSSASWMDTPPDEDILAMSSGEPTATDKSIAALEGAGDVLSWGYQPQIKAKVSQGISAISPWTPQEVLATLDAPISDVYSGKAYEGLPEEAMSYEALRDKVIADKKIRTDKSPLGYGLGMVGGALVSPGSALLKGAAKGFQGAAAATQAATTAANVANTGTKLLTGPVSTMSKVAGVGKDLARAGTIGAVTAAGYNPGDVEGVVDPLQIDERIGAAAIGGGLGVAGSAIPKVAGSLAPKIKELANSMFTKALGRSTEGFKAKLGPEGSVKLGGAVSEQGIFGWLPKTQKGIIEKVQKLKNEAGEKIGKVIDDTHEAEKALIAQGANVGVNKHAIAEKLRADLLDEDSLPDPEIVARVEAKIKAIYGRSPDPNVLPTKAANEMRKKIGARMEKDGAWGRLRNKQQTPNDQVDLAVYKALDKGVDDAVEALAGSSGKDVAARLRSAKKDWSDLKTMDTIATKEFYRGETNNLFSLSSMITGSAAAASQGGIPGIITGLGTMGVSKFGRQYAGKGLEAAAGAANLASKLPPLPPKLAGIGGALTAEKFMDQASNKLAMAPSKGAAAIDITSYNNSQDVETIPVEQVTPLIDRVMASGMTNIEKAMVRRRLEKEGKVSREVLIYLDGGN